ncbi:MAG: hypothetical protein ABI763_17165, partial [Bacteroidota bacterium]
ESRCKNQELRKGQEIGDKRQLAVGSWQEISSPLLISSSGDEIGSANESGVRTIPSDTVSSMSACLQMEGEIRNW